MLARDLSDLAGLRQRVFTDIVVFAGCIGLSQVLPTAHHNQRSANPCRRTS